MTLILIVAGITLIGSFLCSLFEAALYSITPSKLEILRQRGGPGAKKLAELRGKVEEPIAAILTVNTITHTVGSAACGALVGEHYGSGAVGIFAAVFTIAVLLLTEIIPKSIGVRYAETVGPRIAWPLQWMIWMVWPIVKGSGYLMRFFTGGKGEAGPTEEEVVMLSHMAWKEGELLPQERRWVKNALNLDRVTAHDLMTPRTVVETLPITTRLEDIDADAPVWRYSRLPLTTAEGGHDSIAGVALRRVVFAARLRGETGKTLADYAQEADFVKQDMPATELLDHFLKEREHLAIVVDEYGGMEGVVTLEDVMESMLGSQIVDEHDAVADTQALARRQAKLLAEDRASGVQS